MTSCKRFGNRWTINECLQLHREFDLLELSIDEIAQRHQRTVNAIMIKLDSEGHADYNVLYSNYHALNPEMMSHTNEEDEDEDNDDDYEDEDDDESEEDTYEEFYEKDNIISKENISLKKQVLNLEQKVNELTNLLMKQTKGKPVFSLF